MITALIVIVAYVVGAAFVHGYSRHVWTRDGVYDMDDVKRFLASIFWPLALIWLKVFLPISNLSFFTLQKRVEKKLAQNAIRIREAKKVRVSLEQSKQELQEAEEELERELTKSTRTKPRMAATVTSAGLSPPRTAEGSER